MVVCGGAFAGEGGWHFCGVNVVVGGGVWIGDLLFSLLLEGVIFSLMGCLSAGSGERVETVARRCRLGEWGAA